MDLSGTAVSLSSNRTILAAGALYNDGAASSAGHVRVFEYIVSDNVGAWTQLGSDVGGEAAGDQSGTTVSLSSDWTILAVGAPWNGGNDYRAGHVRVFKYVSNDSNRGAWTQLGSDFDGEAANDDSGTAVSLSSGGTILAVGAPWNGGTAFSAGYMRVFEYVAGGNGGAWTQLGSDVDGDFLRPIRMCGLALERRDDLGCRCPMERRHCFGYGPRARLRIRRRRRRQRVAKWPAEKHVGPETRSGVVQAPYRPLDLIRSRLVIQDQHSLLLLNLLGH